MRKIREVLRLKAAGMSGREIAAATGSAPSTVQKRACAGPKRPRLALGQGADRGSSKRLAQTTVSRSYTLTYADRGNVTGNGHRTFTYNAANQMIAADSYSYVYDGNNKRVKQTDSHGTSYSFYGSNGKLMYRNEAGIGVDYYYLGDKLIATNKTAPSPTCTATIWAARRRNRTPAAR